MGTFDPLKSFRVQPGSTGPEHLHSDSIPCSPLASEIPQRVNVALALEAGSSQACTNAQIATRNAPGIRHLGPFSPQRMSGKALGSRGPFRDVRCAGKKESARRKQRGHAQIFLIFV